MRRFGVGALGAIGVFAVRRRSEVAVFERVERRPSFLIAASDICRLGVSIAWPGSPTMPGDAQDGQSRGFALFRSCQKIDDVASQGLAGPCHSAGVTWTNAAAGQACTRAR